MDCSPPNSSVHGVEFSRQEYWGGLPCPPPGDLPDPGIELMSLMSPALAGGFFTTNATWEALLLIPCDILLGLLAFWEKVSEHQLCQIQLTAT